MGVLSLKGKDACKVEHGLCLLGRDVGQRTRGIASASIDTDFEPKSSGKRSGRVQKKRGSKLGWLSSAKCVRRMQRKSGKEMGIYTMWTGWGEKRRR